MQSTRQKNQERWRELVHEAESYPGGVAAYCRANDVSSVSIYNWRRKFKLQAKPLTSQFIRAEVVRPSVNLPDPKWLGEFLFHLSGGGQ